MGLLAFILIVIAIMFLIWLFKGMNFLGPTEMGVRIQSGKLREFCDSGFHFVGRWFIPKNYIEKRPKTTFNLSYPAVEVVTKVDEYEGIKYGSVKLKVEPIAYLKLPRNEHLKEIVESNVPFTKEGLLTFTAESVESALRGVLGQKTWPEIAQHLQEVSQITDVQLKNKGPLKQVGFAEEDFWFGIKKVALPQEIEDALLEPDKARLNLQAASFKAQQQAIEQVGTVLYSMAAGRNLSLEELQGYIQNDSALQKELFEYAQKLNLQTDLAKLGAYFNLDINSPGGLTALVGEIIALLKRFGGGQQPQQTKTTPEEGGGGIIIPKESATSSQVPPGAPLFAAAGTLKPGMKTSDEIRAEEVRIRKEKKKEKK